MHWPAPTVTRTGFARERRKDYCSDMRYFRRFRKAASLLVALAFVLGAFGQMRAAAEQAIAMPVAAMAPMPDGMDCDGSDKAAKHAACVATCAVTAALLDAPFVLPAAVAVGDRLTFAQLPLSGHGPAPEPHPPKH